ncbi:MAG: hypothetical protein HY873_01095 [Chloroflexi bacterium]|nr:hypothetical protein [Chloroflexota bacterium]
MSTTSTCVLAEPSGTLHADCTPAAFTSQSIAIENAGAGVFVGAGMGVFVGVIVAMSESKNVPLGPNTWKCSSSV